MSGTAQGPVCIEIERPTFEASGEEYNITGYVIESPALLTRELQQQIERQNIDCRDINCMKWPIMGMSRWAEFKCLLLKSQLDRLISEPRPTTDDWNGFKIYFIVGSRDQSKSTIFPRMVLADVKPLMISEFGPQVPPANPGDPATYNAEALYLCTFRCRRWAARGYRIDDSAILGTMNQPSWYAGGLKAKFPGSSFNLTRKEFVDEVLGQLIIAPENIYRDVIDIKDLTPISPAPPAVPATFPIRWNTRVNYALLQSQVPAYQLIDDITCRSDIMLSCIPDPDNALVRFDSKIRINCYPIADGTRMLPAFLNKYGQDIIAGSITNLGGGSFGYLTGFANKCVFTQRIWNDLREERIRTYFPLFHYANGMPPNVFNVADISTMELPPESYAFSASTWFDLNSGIRTGERRSSLIPAGKSGFAVINSDELPDITSGRLSDLFALGDTSQVTVANRIESRPFNSSNDRDVSAFANKTNCGLCDIWFRGWVMPDYTELWAGAMFLELRLQTDDKGFGFPTTRIYSDLDDPLLGPVLDDGFTGIESTGLVSSWKTTTGRTRIHAEWPFGIPCMLRIYDHEEVAPNVWRYKCDTIQLADKDDTTPSGDEPTYHGGLRRAGYGTNMGAGYQVPAGKEIIAYNLTELANTSTFAGPGYKTPLTQAGFSVLPIGMDRDGNKSPVIVLAHLYQAPVPNFEDPDYFLTVAYFSLTNAVDGECDTSPLTEPDVDGGGFGET